MTMITEIEKIPNPPLMRKKFRTNEVYQMIRIGILPEESGWELIDGEIIQKMPTGSKHAGTVKRLNRILTNLFTDDAIISIQDPIHIDEHNEPEPDVALLKPRDDFYEENHPKPEDVLLLIEVSDSTLEYDRETKKTMYAEAGIKEFWLVNLKQDLVETYTDPANGVYYEMKIFGRGETASSKHITALSLETDGILGEPVTDSETEN